jgi:fumarate reductase subunit D
MTSPHGSSGERPPERAPSPRSRSAWLDRLWAALGATGAIFAVVGGLLYLVLSLACTAVYSPLGVTPAEIGMDYGNLLAQSAVGVAALTVIAMLAGLAVVAFRMAIARPSVKRHRPWPTLVASSVAIAFSSISFCRCPFWTARPSALRGPRLSSRR